MKNIKFAKTLILNKAFEAMSRNNNQYGWEVWKNKPYEWWVAKELEYYQKITSRIKSQTILKLYELQEGTIDLNFIEEHEDLIYDNGSGDYGLQPLARIILACYEGLNIAHFVTTEG